LRLTRKVMLKGAAMADVGQDMAGILAIMVVIALAAMLRYRRTLG